MKTAIIISFAKFASPLCTGNRAQIQPSQLFLESPVFQGRAEFGRLPGLRKTSRLMINLEFLLNLFCWSVSHYIVFIKILIWSSGSESHFRSTNKIRQARYNVFHFNTSVETVFEFYQELRSSADNHVSVSFIEQRISDQYTFTQYTLNSLSLSLSLHIHRPDTHAYIYSCYMKLVNHFLQKVSGQV